LYYRLHELLVQVCSGVSQELLQAPNIVILYVARWNNYSTGIKCINGLFDYLNRYWIRLHGPGGELPVKGVHRSVHDMGVAVWRDRVQIAPVSQCMLDELWHMAMQARSGEGMDYALASHVLSIYRALGRRPAHEAEGGEGMAVYDSDFAEPFVRQTLHMYSLEARQLVSEEDCSAFVLRCALTSAPV
jgi:hypothetical protein